MNNYVKNLDITLSYEDFITLRCSLLHAQDYYKKLADISSAAGDTDFLTLCLNSLDGIERLVNVFDEGGSWVPANESN